MYDKLSQNKKYKLIINDSKFTFILYCVGYRRLINII